MKRKNSLKGRSAFREVLNRGAKLQDRHIRIYILRCNTMNRVTESRVDNEGPDTSKFGVYLHRRFGKANERNKMRRRIKAICRAFIDCIKVNSYIVFRPERGFLDLSFREENMIIVRLLAKANIIRGQCH